MYYPYSYFRAAEESPIVIVIISITTHYHISTSTGSTISMPAVSDSTSRCHRACWLKMLFLDMEFYLEGDGEFP